MISGIDVLGYIASVFVALSFYSRMMIPLRIFALCSNVFFILYGFLTHAYPVLILHVVMLPLNSYRLFQITRLINKVKEAASGSCSLEFLIPFMISKKFRKGELIFRKGDKSDSMYFIYNGLVRLTEIDKVEGKGASLGEFGIFSPIKERTLTAECSEDTEVGIIPEEKIMQLFYQNPNFSFYITQLIVKRYIEFAKLWRK